ncbi:MAG: hypothetical protein LUH43_03995, partial [Clostridia bacterium]|nr:hypothetical protein [Clostridia bacterium]
NFFFFSFCGSYLFVAYIFEKNFDFLSSAAGRRQFTPGLSSAAIITHMPIWANRTSEIQKRRK